MVPFLCKALLFDLDGTLVDSTAVVNAVMESWCREQGLPLQPVLEASYGARTEDTVALVAPHLDARAEAARIDAMEYAALGGLMPVVGAGRFLASLTTVPWAVVTSSLLEHAITKLEVCNLPVPDTLITAESVSHGKPHPEPFLLAAARLGLEPGECLVFEDADNGARSALGAGCKVILAGTGCQIEHPDILGRIDTFADIQLKPGGELWVRDEMVATCR